MDEDKKNDEPDFSAFVDWHVTEQTEKWLPFLADLTVNQKRIVEKNVRLLLDKKKWHAHVVTFEAELTKILDGEAQKKKRAEFEIHFDGHNFSQEENDYSNIHFPCSVYFDNAQFGEGGVFFDNAQFEKGNVSFNGAQFRKGDVSFMNAQFGEGDVFLSNTQFGEGDVFFDDAQFEKGEISFVYAKFGEGSVHFDRVQFGDCDVSFHHAQFGRGNIYCDNSQFGKGDLSFDDVQLEGADILFSRNTIEGSFFMRNVTFPQLADFHSLTFKGPVFFSGSTFKEVPSFRDTVFGRPTEISNIQIPPAQMKRTWLFKKSVDKEDVHKYRMLKSMAQDAHDHNMEGYFFAQEMRAKRGVEIHSPWELLVHGGYYTLSNYGQSYWRPSIGLLGSFAVFMVFYFLLLLFFIKPINALPFAAEYSLRHTLPFIGTFLRFSPYPPDHPSWFSETLHHLAHEGAPLGWMAYIGLFQSILGLILLFLLALGLRNAFRMK